MPSFNLDVTKYEVTNVTDYPMKIVNLPLQISGWQASTEKLLQVFDRLRGDVEEQASEVEGVKERIEATADYIREEQKEEMKAVEKRVDAVKVSNTLHV